MKNQILNRRNLLLSAAVALLTFPLVLFAVKAFAGQNETLANVNHFTEVNEKSAGPTGTFPTMLNATVSSLNSTQMRVQGRYSTVAGNGIAAMRVDIYSVAEGSFAKIYTGFTGGSGNFDFTILKPSPDRKIQVVIDGNGTYSQPFPTFNRP